MSSAVHPARASAGGGVKKALWSIVGLAGFVAAWEVLVRFFDVPTFLIPPPSLVIKDLADFPGWFAVQAAYTAGITVAGFVVATVLGVAFAVVLVESPLLDRLLFPLFVALNSVPKVAVAPLCLIWFGTGTFTKVVIAMMIAVFAVVIDASLGLRSVHQDVLDMATALRGSRWKVLTRIRLHAALPSIFAGMKVAMSLALVGAIVGEFVSSQTGLGHVILVAQGQFDTPRVFASLLLLSVIGVVLIGSLDLLERRAMPWKFTSHRKPPK
ncbi:MAG: ABC transporter permease [Burkholderiaceae bacterium]